MKLRNNSEARHLRTYRLQKVGLSWGEAMRLLTTTTELWGALDKVSQGQHSTEDADKNGLYPLGL